jgi:geranylgeranyl diphosphate synthase type II
VFRQQYNTYKSLVEKRLLLLIKGKQPFSVYEPIRYIVAAGGKRVRAVLVMLSCEAVGGRASKALDAAAAIEILHNFTLVHDDVMDHADMRRGVSTIHKRWDENVAILAGDELVALAYRSLLKTKTPNLKKVLDVFTKAFIEVCEGQGFDKEFETRNNVHLQEYLLMIEKKTACMIAAATEIGALIGEGSKREVTALRKFGQELGMAFQIQDDLLDIVGDEREFGKAIGGDVYEGKKTYLLLKALEHVKGADKKLLQSIMPGNGITRTTVERVRTIYEQTGVLNRASEEVERHTLRARRALKVLPSSTAKEMLLWISDQLLRRTS